MLRHYAADYADIYARCAIIITPSLPLRHWLYLRMRCDAIYHILPMILRHFHFA